MLYNGETGRSLRTQFSEHRRAVCTNDASQPVVRHFNSGSYVVSDVKIRVLSPISCSNDRHKASFPLENFFARSDFFPLFLCFQLQPF